MKVVVLREHFVSLISKIQSIVAPKPSIPILGNVLLEAVNDQLIISATDLTVSMRAFTEAKVLEAGAITLPARRLFQLTRELTAFQMEIETSGETAAIQSGSSHFKLQGMHQSEFPTFPDLSDALTMTFNASQLKDMLSRVSFAAARDDSRQVLNGVYFQKVDQLATFVGTDGKRLAKVETALQETGSSEGRYVLPLKAVEEMVKILDNAEEATKLFFMADKMAIEVGSITLISKLLSGQYPDVSRVIPQKGEAPISLHREELISLLRQVALFTSDTSSSVRFTFSSGELHLSAASGEIGEGKVSMPVNYEGPKVEIAFNPHYFLDILRHSRDETVNFDFSDSYNPGLITDSSSAQFVLMPMRLEVCT